MWQLTQSDIELKTGWCCLVDLVISEKSLDANISVDSLIQYGGLCCLRSINKHPRDNSVATLYGLWKQWDFVCINNPSLEVDLNDPVVGVRWFVLVVRLVLTFIKKTNLNNLRFSHCSKVFQKFGETSRFARFVWASNCETEWMYKWQRHCNCNWQEQWVIEFYIWVWQKFKSSWFSRALLWKNNNKCCCESFYSIIQLRFFWCQNKFETSVAAT